MSNLVDNIYGWFNSRFLWTGGDSKYEQLLCEQFLRQIEISRAFLPPVSHGEKLEKFQFAVQISHEAVILILICL